MYSRSRGMGLTGGWAVVSSVVVARCVATKHATCTAMLKQLQYFFPSLERQPKLLNVACFFDNAPCVHSRTIRGSQCVGVERGWWSISSEGVGVRGCAGDAGTIARRRHKDGALNAADKNEKFET